MRKKIIVLHGKRVSVELGEGAERELAKRDAPLFAEVQLIFGCMIAKRVWFRDDPMNGAVRVTENLRIWFRAARYNKACSFADIDSGAEASDYPMVAERKLFVPDRVNIDFNAGKWCGDFTYSRELNRAQNPAAGARPALVWG